MSGTILPKPFDGSEHRSFVWTEGDHAALLIHGFPGTPAEMLPLRTVLRDAGWTVHGMIYRDKFFTKLELITFIERKVKNLSGIMCDKKS